ncbi:hypothetical protein ACLB1T_17415 [Escherichia coli]
MEQGLIGIDDIAVIHMPDYGDIVACQLNKHLFNPAFAAKDAILAGDHRGMREREFSGKSFAVISLLASTVPPKSSRSAWATAPGIWGPIWFPAARHVGCQGYSGEAAC